MNSPGACKIAETLILNQVCTVTVPDTHSIGDIMLQKLLIKGLPNNPWLYSLKLQQDLKRVLVVWTEYNIKGNVRKGRYTKYPDVKKRERPLLVGSVKVSWRRWSLSLALKNKDDMAAYSNRQAGKHGGKLWIRSL